MGLDRRTDDGEKGMYRMAVNRLKINGIFKKAQTHHRSVNVEGDGIADMRDGDAVADGGGPNRFRANSTWYRNSRSTSLGNERILTTLFNTAALSFPSTR